MPSSLTATVLRSSFSGSARPPSSVTVSSRPLRSAGSSTPSRPTVCQVNQALLRLLCNVYASATRYDCSMLTGEAWPPMSRNELLVTWIQDPPDLPENGSPESFKRRGSKVLRSIIHMSLNMSQSLRPPITSKLLPNARRLAPRRGDISFKVRSPHCPLTRS
eukprot:XP_001705238.1 Hypothetical protein GL50803_31647 [Giardia lamblia ATCC 50803]